MSLSEKAKKKLSNIGKYPTNLAGFYQFKSKEEAIETINRYQVYLNDDGTFKKPKIDADCDPNYQQLSAAIDYYKFNVERPPGPYQKKFT